MKRQQRFTADSAVMMSMRRGENQIASSFRKRGVTPRFYNSRRINWLMTANQNF